MNNKFSNEVFENPGKEYRGTPFWAWNTALNKVNLKEQIAQFKEMGMGGFFMHTRVGLDTTYLGEEFMSAVKECVSTAKQEELYACLYDEDRWPSGYGGGYVTKNPLYRSKSILITPFKKGSKKYTLKRFDSQAASEPQGNGDFLAAYSVLLNGEGALADYTRCSEDAPEQIGRKIWYVYLETAHDSPWFNNQAYVDTLNPEAIQAFLDITYEKYAKAVGSEFGKTIPYMFTDEPQFPRKNCLGSASMAEELMLPFTTDFPESFYAVYGEDILEHIPELIWELPEGAASKYRYWYHDHITERFAQAYGDQVGKWCVEHNIKLCGHMMEEPTLQSQTQALGEVMRSLRGFSMPGVDMLCDAREYTTVKQAQSVAHQFARAGVSSELYGVTNWDFDFRRHKLQGDWQAALGVTNRVHHLTWMSMGGEAKRDYPASIGMQSPWYREYKLIEDHFARVNTAMTLGNPVVRVAVLHPVESFWVLYGPNEQTSIRREELDLAFRNITEWLLFQTIDFDYISESLLRDEWNGQSVGSMQYEAVLIPECITIRKSTLCILKEMQKNGTEIIFAGNVPRYVDAQQSNEAVTYSEQCRTIPFTEKDVIQTLEAYRELEVRFSADKFLKKPNHKKNWKGLAAKKYIYQLRKTDDGRWLFIANGRKQENEDLTLKDCVDIRIKGSWTVELYDTMTGMHHAVESSVENGRTIVPAQLYQHDSLLLHLTKRKETAVSHCTEQETFISSNLYLQPLQIQREEKNVLVLDMPEYAFDDRQWHGREEILRIDNQYRELLGYPMRRAALAQPWVTQSVNDDKHILYLKYQIFCRDDMENLELALEELDKTELCVDGESLAAKQIGFYVDKSISIVKMPDLKQGIHELLLTVQYHEKTNIEACFLLGDFDAVVRGVSTQIMKTDKANNKWGNLALLGMPFYGGNVSYKITPDLEKGQYKIEISKYRAAVLKVLVDGRLIGSIFMSPYELTFSIEESGQHEIEIICFGCRINTFGTLHNCDEEEIYFDPNAWRTEDEGWSYEYQLKTVGILKAPVLKKTKEERE